MGKARHTKKVKSPYPWKGLKTPLMILGVPDQEQEKCPVASTRKVKA